MGIWIAILGVMLTLFAGCGEKTDPVQHTDGGMDGDGAQGSDVGPVTYGNQIKPVMDQNCISCHATSKQGPDRQGAPLLINFDTYQNAQSAASRANSRIQAGTMPPTGSLGFQDKTLFQSWLDQGALE